MVNPRAAWKILVRYAGYLAPLRYGPGRLPGSDRFRGSITHHPDSSGSMGRRRFIRLLAGVPFIGTVFLRGNQSGAPVNSSYVPAKPTTKHWIMLDEAARPLTKEHLEALYRHLKACEEIPGVGSVSCWVSDDKTRISKPQPGKVGTSHG